MGPPMIVGQQQQQKAVTTTQQLQQARDYLASLQDDRAGACSDLEEEAKVFLSSPSTDDQERHFRLIYQLVRYQVLVQSKQLVDLRREREERGERGVASEESTYCCAAVSAYMGYAVGVLLLLHCCTTV